MEKYMTLDETNMGDTLSEYNIPEGVDFLEGDTLKSALDVHGTEVIKIYKNDIRSKIKLARICVSISEIKIYEDGKKILEDFLATLPFDKPTYMKWVSIGRSTFIKSFVDNNKIDDLPNDYNSLYSLATDKFGGLTEDKKTYIRESLEESKSRRDIDTNIKNMFDDKKWVGIDKESKKMKLFTNTYERPKTPSEDNRFKNTLATIKVDTSSMELKDFWVMKSILNNLINDKIFDGSHSKVFLKESDVVSVENSITGIKNKKDETDYLRKLEMASKKKKSSKT